MKFLISLCNCLLCAACKPVEEVLLITATQYCHDEVSGHAAISLLIAFKQLCLSLISRCWAKHQAYRPVAGVINHHTDGPGSCQLILACEEQDNHD